MSTVTVLFDACVLYPAPLRDFLMYLALGDVFHAKWTEAIHDEWTRSLLKNRPDLRPEQLQRTRNLMNSHVRDCLVTNYEHLIPTLALPDPDDRHVLAAAIQSEANVILTFNLNDFPESALKPYAIEALHPDNFLASHCQQAAQAVCLAAKRHRTSLKHPPKSVAEYLAALEAMELVRTVAALRQFTDLI